MTSILFLSPHPDDIAWSIGCLVDKIAHLSDSRMITLFSVCNYTCGWQKVRLGTKPLILVDLSPS